MAVPSSGSTARAELQVQIASKRWYRYSFCGFILATWFCAGMLSKLAFAKEPELYFGLVGDLSYFPEHWIERVFDDVRQDHSLAFAVHLGGLARPDLACTDDIRRRRLAQFKSSLHPFVYTPGHKDWADCLGKEEDRVIRPLAILSMLRTTFFYERISGWRTKMDLASQGSLNAAFASYRENWRWQVSKVTFMTLHVIGGNNNLGRSPDTDKEFTARTSANLAWLRAGFDYAALHRSQAVVLFMQADVFRAPSQSFARRRPSGYFRLREAIEREAQLFAKPVMIAHSELDDDPWRDSDNRPHRAPKNVMRVGAFSTPRQHWIRASVSNQPVVFTLTRKQLNSR